MRSKDEHTNGSETDDDLWGTRREMERVGNYKVQVVGSGTTQLVLTSTGDC